MPFTFAEALSMAVGIASLCGIILMGIKFSRQTSEYHKQLREEAIAAASRLQTMEVKIEELSRKCDLSNPDTRIIWLFHLRRAQLEANDAGYGKMESPFTFHEREIQRMDPLRDKLLEFHAAEGHALDPVSAMIRIEDRFGAELVEKVCIPSGMKNGVCLLLALCVSRGTRTVNLEATSDETESTPGSDIIPSAA